MKGVYVVGFMGAGKSTVGQALARRLGWRFVDLDDAIEAAEGARISEIFEARGEAAFREMESTALAREVAAIAAGHPAVVALGGGAFTIAANRELLRGRGTSVWLDCPFEMVERRVAQAAHRPLARDPQRFAELYRTRRETYAVADVRIEIDCDDPEAAVDAIVTQAGLA
jgi:shikimate kinase